jgi:HEAT repeat protein
VGGILKTLEQEDALKSFAAIADQDSSDRTAQLHEFFRACGEDGIVPVIALAGLVKDDRFIGDILHELAPRNPQRCVQGLHNDNPASVVAALKAIGKAGDASLSTHLRVCLKNAAPEVRSEAARTLGKLGGDDGVELLGALLTDSDTSVRREAAAMLGGLGGSRAVELLQQHVLGKSFVRKVPDEKRAFLTAVARSGGAESIITLEAILSKRRFLRREKQNESRACAAQALALVPDAKTRSILEKFQSDRALNVRVACQAALSRMDERQKEKTGNE